MVTEMIPKMIVTIVPKMVPKMIRKMIAKMVPKMVHGGFKQNAGHARLMCLKTLPFHVFKCFAPVCVFVVCLGMCLCFCCPAETQFYLV